VLSILTSGVARAESTDPAFSVLVFSKTAGYRHDSIPSGIAAIRALGERNDFRVDASEDATVFNDTNLAQYRVVVLLSTTGDIFNPSEQAAFERFIRRGGGFVGIHSATDTEYDWPFYGQLVGAYFKAHPGIQPATVRMEVTDHPATTGLPSAWTRTDEWYDFQTNPRATVTVLATVDESSYTGGTMGADHPIVWTHTTTGGGRAFYTAMGHTIESYADPQFRQHLAGAIRWAAGP